MKQSPSSQCPAPCRRAVSSAIARLRRDLDRLRLDRPAVAYALLGETHRAIMEDWRGAEGGGCSNGLAAWLECLREEAAGLMHQLHVLSVSGGTPEAERARLTMQADMALEEIRRIEGEIAGLRPSVLAA